MKTLIEGGWVVAFNGTSHEVYANGSVVYENDRIVHAGGPYTGTVDMRLSARGKLVSPALSTRMCTPLATARPTCSTTW